MLCCVYAGAAAAFFWVFICGYLVGNVHRCGCRHRVYTTMKQYPKMEYISFVHLAQTVRCDFLYWCLFCTISAQHEHMKSVCSDLKLLLHVACIFTFTPLISTFWQRIFTWDSLNASHFILKSKMQTISSLLPQYEIFR